MIINVDTDSLSICFENMTEIEFERILEVVDEITGDFESEDFE